MARKKVSSKKKQVSTKGKSAGLTGIGKTVSSTAGVIVDEVEKAGEVMLREIREGFDVVTDKASHAVKAAADASVTVKDKVSDAQPKQLMMDFVSEVEEIGESLVEGISSRITQLRDAVVGAVAEAKAPARKKAGKKKVAAKKKAAPKKKTAAKKKAAPKKKVAAKKKAAPKNSSCQEESGSQEKSRSQEESGSQEKSRSQEESGNQEKSRSQEESGNQEKSHSQEKGSYQEEGQQKKLNCMGGYATAYPSSSSIRL